MKSPSRTPLSAGRTRPPAHGHLHPHLLPERPTRRPLHRRNRLRLLCRRRNRSITNRRLVGQASRLSIWTGPRVVPKHHAHNRPKPTDRTMTHLAKSPANGSLSPALSAGEGYPEGVPSFSPGLRGTSYPGFPAGETLNPEGVASRPHNWATPALKSQIPFGPRVCAKAPRAALSNRLLPIIYPQRPHDTHVRTKPAEPFPLSRVVCGTTVREAVHNLGHPSVAGLGSHWAGVRVPRSPNLGPASYPRHPHKN